MVKSMCLWCTAWALLLAACGSDANEACAVVGDDSAEACTADPALEARSQDLSLHRVVRFSVSAAVQPVAAGTIVASSHSPGARCDAEGCHVWFGSSVTLEATPAPDFIFLGWSGCRKGGPGPLTLRFVHEDQACVAQFAPSFVIVSLGVSGMYRGQGQMTAPGQTCGPQTCAVPYGTPVTVRAPVSESYRFVRWGSCSDSGDPVLVLSTETTNRSIACVAIMEPITHEVSWNVADGGGSIRLVGTGPDIRCGAASCAVVLGAGIRLEALPDEGYRFAEWSGCADATEAVIGVLDVREARHCEAHFEPAALAE